MILSFQIFILFASRLSAAGTDPIHVSSYVGECDSVNLSHSVVIIPAESSTNSVLYFKIDTTDPDKDSLSQLNFYPDQEGYNISFEWGEPASLIYKTHNSTIDKFIVLVKNEELLVFSGTQELAAWSINSWTEKNHTKRLKLIQDAIAIKVLKEKASQDIIVSDRCIHGCKIDTTSKVCKHCHSWAYAPGFTTNCAEEASWCKETTLESPYGEYPVIATTIGNVRHYKCLYDQNEDMTVSVRCDGNNTWGEMDTSLCKNTKISPKLEKLLDDQTITEDEMSIELTRILEDWQYIGSYDILVIYDIVNKIHLSVMDRKGKLSKHVAKHVVTGLSYVMTSSSCLNNLYCYWILEKIREMTPYLETKATLVLSDTIGMYYHTGQTDILDLNTFCQHNFHDYVTGCQNDGLQFLRIEEGELQRLWDGTKQPIINLSLVFSKDHKLFPSQNIVENKNFNQTLYTPGANVSDTVTVASMIVDVRMTGDLPNDTKIKLSFTVNSDVAFSENQRTFSVFETTYSMFYECTHYKTNMDFNKVKEKLTVKDPYKLSQEDWLLDYERKHRDNSSGTWDPGDCETTYNTLSDTPLITCTCNFCNGSFAVLAKVKKKAFPSYYVEILISLLGITCVGLLLSIIILVIPNKLMSIPVAAKHNIAFMAFLLIITLAVISRKVHYEFANYYIE